MTIKIAILNTYITSTNFVVSFFFLSGPVRLKNYLTSGKNNSDVDDNVVQENLSKLWFIFYCLDFYSIMDME